MSDCEKPCGYPQMDCALGVYITKCEDIEELEAKLTKAVEALRGILKGDDMYPWRIAREVLAELEAKE